MYAFGLELRLTAYLFPIWILKVHLITWRNRRLDRVPHDVSKE